MISILISTINDPNLERTVNNLRENAEGEIEFIVVNDGGSPVSIPHTTVLDNERQLGRRVSFNKAARIAQGDFLFVIDSHCSMSKGWDLKMSESVRENNLVFCVIRDMWPDTWEYRGGDYLHVRVDRNYNEKWWPLKQLKDCKVEEESIAITGCAWMVTKAQWNRLGGYDESLGEYGWDGPEWSMKIWLEGNGKVILRTDVICGHIFGTNEHAVQYPCKMIPQSEYVKYMKERYDDKIWTLIDRFGDVPDWKKGNEMTKKTTKGSQKVTEGKKTTIHQKVEHDTKDDKTGEIIQKVVEYKEYDHYYKEGEMTPEEIAEKYADRCQTVRTEVFKLKDGKLQKVGA